MARVQPVRSNPIDLSLLGDLVGARPAVLLLNRFGTLREIAQACPEELCGLGLRARHQVILRAAFAVGVRAAGAIERGSALRSSRDVAKRFAARLALSPVEEFFAVALDVRHRIMREILLARGSLTGVDIHPRDAFRPLIQAGAAAVIFVHNHPSGDPTPSDIDRELTVRLRETGRLVGIKVLDHVVVAAGGRFRQISGRPAERQVR